MATQESNMDSQLHFLLIPLGSPGHYIPTIDMARLFAQHGVIVTIVTTPVCAARFCSILDGAIQSGLPIRFLEFPFPYAEFGLPEGCETLDSLPSWDMTAKVFHAFSSLQQEVENCFERLNPRPSCIVSDTFLLWPGDTAKKFQIPRIVFDGMNCFTQVCSHVLHLSKVYEREDDSEPFVLPGLPDHIELTRSQLPLMFKPVTKEGNDFNKRMHKSESEAYGVVVNSFEELEKCYVDEYRKVKADKVWCIGPLSLCHRDDSEKVQRGNQSSIDKNECFRWLDSQESCSVTYACLGSLSRVEPALLIELALALEASNRPFIWVVRAGPKTNEIEKWMKEEGFEKRTKAKGLLIRGWAPQVLILSHPAIGGFLTHCGWNSTLEGVCAGVPLITWPYFQDQFFNEKLIVQVLEIGVSVRAQRVVLGQEDEVRMTAERVELKKAIDMVMQGGKEGEDRRNRAKELAKIANKAIEEGGSSHRNMKQLIEVIRNEARTWTSGQENHA